MVGLPDGLGAFDNGDGSITVLMNHELGSNAGAVHAHGARGAFVSKWRILKRDLSVLEGEDLIKSAKLWDADKSAYLVGENTAFSRFCSADLASKTAFFNRKTGKGFGEGRIFMSGEEDGLGKPRGFAHVVGGLHDGTSYDLPLFGRHPFENLLASPYEQDRTIVVANEDGRDNKVYFYIGEKQAKGGPIERAGLSNGQTYELQIEAYDGDEPENSFKPDSFKLVEKDGTSLSRPEDGAWDTQDPNRYYFVTTSNYKGNSRLWELRFDDVSQPGRGGKVRVLIEGKVSGPKMMDNIAVDGDGNIYIQEDVGKNPHLGKLWVFSPKSGALRNIAQHDPSLFIKAAPGFLTENEESSGIVDVSGLFKDVEGYDTARNHYLLLVVQAHYPLGDELVEGGQLLLMKIAREAN